MSWMIDVLPNLMWLGGHLGHYAEVNFKWIYPAQVQPCLVILHEGKVIYCGQMNQFKKGGNGTDSSPKDNEEDTVFELALVSIPLLAS